MHEVGAVSIYQAWYQRPQPWNEEEQLYGFSISCRDGVSWDVFFIFFHKLWYFFIWSIWAWDMHVEQCTVKPCPKIRNKYENSDMRVLCKMFKLKQSMFVLCYQTACWSTMPTQVSCDRIAEGSPWWLCLALWNEMLFPMQSQCWKQYEVSLFLSWLHWPSLSHVDQQASGEDPESWKHGPKTCQQLTLLLLKCY